MNRVEVVAFPRPGVRAAAVGNSDGAFTFYVGAHLSEKDREEAVEELSERIVKEGAE